MPDDEKPATPHEPVPIPSELMREAEAEAWHLSTLAQAAVQTLRYWADPSKVPSYPGSNRWDSHGPPVDIEAALEQVRETVAVLRRARAVLSGIRAPAGEEDGRHDEKTLVHLVDEAAAETAHIKPDDPNPLHTLGLIVDAVVGDYAGHFSDPTWLIVRGANVRPLLVHAVSLKTGHTRAKTPKHRGQEPSWPRWLEPLHEVAKLASLPGGKASVLAWYKQLRTLKILGSKRP